MLSNTDKCVSDNNKVSPNNALSKVNVEDIVNKTKEIRSLKEQIVEIKQGCNNVENLNPKTFSNDKIKADLYVENKDVNSDKYPCLGPQYQAV